LYNSICAENVYIAAISYGFLGIQFAGIKFSGIKLEGIKIEKKSK